MRKALLLLDLSRSRSALLSLGEPVLGVLLAGRGIPSLRVSLLGLVAALAGYFCVYSLNDLLDLKADREELRVASSDPLSWSPAVTHLDITTLRHPVAAGALPLWVAVTWVSVLGVIGLSAAYLLRPLCAWLFVACALLEVLYCSLRRLSWLKTIVCRFARGTGSLGRMVRRRRGDLGRRGLLRPALHLGGRRPQPLQRPCRRHPRPNGRHHHVGQRARHPSGGQRHHCWGQDSCPFSP